MRLAIAVFALASCRAEAPVESRPQPLEPSGKPIAQAPVPPSEDTDDRTSIEDQLPPSLYAANAGPKDKADKPVKADKPDKPAPRAKSARLAPFNAELCVTTGSSKIGGKIEKPMRAVAKGTDGEGASLTFTFNGELENMKKLDSGAVRRQIGLKLRAENGCNLIYVMWRLDPKPMILAQVKRNPGQKDHKGCGSGGYKWVKAKEQHEPPSLTVGTKYTLRAEIENEELSVFVDDTLYWRGALPASVRDLRGPAGIRSDNLAFDLVSFEAAVGTDAGNAKCVAEDKD
jgi:hypothetical protein